MAGIIIKKSGFHVLFACLMILLVTPVFSQFSQVTKHHPDAPFDALPQKDSCKFTRIKFDPVFIPNFKTHHLHKSPAVRVGQIFNPATMDVRFYILCGILLLLGFLLRSSPKYFNNLFGLLLRSGFRQKSIRDQLIQNKLTSLTLNMLFFLAGGLFIYLLVQHLGLVSTQPWYIQAAISISFLSIIYIVKYISIITGGWIFASNDLANQYVFIVFFVNKIAGLFLLPMVVILWVGNPVLYPFFNTVSLILVGFLFLYRYYLILPLVRSKSGISAFHFFLYLCTFEFLPILLLVKFLVDFLNSSN